MTPRITVALDPGKRKMGVAICADGRLIYAGPVYVRGEWSETAAVNAIQAVVDSRVPEDTPVARWDLERPQVYRNTGRASVQADVEALTRLVDRLARELRPLTEVRVHAPFAWKRSVPKPVHHRRIRHTLSEAEVKCIETDGKAAALDVWDAVGLALFAVGRVGVGGAHHGA